MQSDCYREVLNHSVTGREPKNVWRVKRSHWLWADNRNDYMCSQEENYWQRTWKTGVSGSRTESQELISRDESAFRMFICWRSNNSIAFTMVNPSKYEVLKYLALAIDLSDLRRYEIAVQIALLLFKLLSIRNFLHNNVCPVSCRSRRYRL